MAREETSLRIAKLRVVVVVVVVAHTTPQLKVQSVPEHHPRIEH